MKLLDIDKLAKGRRTILLGGKEYPVLDMTVENFIETTEESRKLEANKDATLVDQVRVTLGVIRRSIPDAPVEDLNRLTLDQLILVAKFIRGELDEQTEVVEEVGEDGKKK